MRYSFLMLLAYLVFSHTIKYELLLSDEDYATMNMNIYLFPMAKLNYHQICMKTE